MPDQAASRESARSQVWLKTALHASMISIAFIAWCMSFVMYHRSAWVYAASESSLHVSHRVPGDNELLTGTHCEGWGVYDVFARKT